MLYLMLMGKTHVYIAMFLLFALWQENALKRGKLEREYHEMYPSVWVAYILTVIVCLCPLVNLLALYYCIRDMSRDVRAAVRSEMESRRY